MLLIIDHKHGNIGSLVNALEFIGFEYKIINKYDQSVVRIASGFILPDGSFGWMNALKARGLDNNKRMLEERYKRS